MNSKPILLFGANYRVFNDPRKSANKWQNELSDRGISTVMTIAAESKVGQLYLGK